jgi:hypothetical protein
MYMRLISWTRHRGSEHLGLIIAPVKLLLMFASVKLRLNVCICEAQVECLHL